MSRLKFREITIVEGPEIDEWLARQEELERADQELIRRRIRTAYRLLGGTLDDDSDRVIPMELLS